METSLELKEELKKSQPSLTEAGLQGRLKKSQLPYAMGDLYRDEADNDGRSRSGNNDIVVMVYLTPAAAAAALLPSEFSLPKLPAAGELTPVSLAFAKQGESRMIRPYNEVAVLIPCLYNGQSYSYCPYNWVDTEQALVCGREFFGFPAKLATFDLKCSDTQFIGAMERHGVRVVSINFTQQKELFYLPLPADEKVVLPAPFDQMFALPEPTGKPQGLPPLKELTTRFIANAIAPQHIVSHWTWERGTVWAGNGSIEYAVSDDDPLSKLPVMHMVASVRFRGDSAYYDDDTRVLTDMA